MRNTYLKDVRKAWEDSKVLFGKTKVMAKALGTTPEDEYQENLYKLSKVRLPLDFSDNRNYMVMLGCW